MKKILFLFFVVLLALTAQTANAYDSMYLRGDMNGWGGTKMTKNGNIWSCTVTLSAQNYEYKFSTKGDTWDGAVQWGEGSGFTGTQTQNKGNASVRISQAGEYIFSFNESTLAFSIALKDAPSEITIKVENNAALQTALNGQPLACYAWNDVSNKPLGNFPGTAMTLKNGWYSITVSSGYYVMFNDNKSTGGKELKFRENQPIYQDYCLQINSEFNSCTEVSCPAVGPTAVTVTPSPIAGAYNNGTSVTLGTTPSSAALQYQLNGTDGTWTDYSEAISLANNATTTIYVKAKNADDYKITGSDENGVVSYVYTTNIPQITVDATVTPGAYSNGKKVSFTTTPSVSSLLISVNGGTAESYIPGTSITLPDNATTTYTFSSASVSEYTISGSPSYSYETSEITTPTTFQIKVKKNATSGTSSSNFRIHIYGDGATDYYGAWRGGTFESSSDSEWHTAMKSDGSIDIPIDYYSSGFKIIFNGEGKGQSEDITIPYSAYQNGTNLYFEFTSFWGYSQIPALEVTATTGTLNDTYSFTNEFTVQLAASGPMADENTIVYYTLDGSTPSNKSTQYDESTPIVISDDTTLKAIAISNGVTSPVATYQYKKQSISLSCLAASASPESFTVYGGKTFNAEVFAKGATSARYTTDGGLNWTSFTDHATVAISETTTITVEATDGNQTVSNKYSYIYAPAGNTPNENIIPNVGTTSSNAAFYSIYPKATTAYTNEPTVLQFRIKGTGESANHQIDLAWDIQNVGTYWAAAPTNKLSNYKIGEAGGYTYYQFIIDANPKNFIDQFDKNSNYSSIGTNTINGFKFRAWDKSSNTYETYSVSYSRSNKEVNTSARKEICITVNQYDPINKNLPNLLAELNNDYSDLQTSDTEWYMDDPTYFEAVTEMADNVSIEYRNYQHKWYEKMKYPSGRYPWINSHNVGTTTFYAYPSGTSTESNQYRIIVNVLPTQDNVYERETLFFEDFGSGNSETIVGPALEEGKTNYDYYKTEDCKVQDGGYSIIQYIPEGKFCEAVGTTGEGYTWRDLMTDHTTGNYGYMYLVNANDKQNGQFYEQTIDVCENTQMRLSFWIASALNGRKSDDITNGYHIKPNVHLEVTDLSGNVIAETWTGEIMADQAWEQHFLDFKTTEGMSQITIKLLNVEVGGNGNDFAIDDIRIERQVGTLRFETASPTCIRPGDEYLTVKVDQASVYEALDYSSSAGAIYYKWVKIAPASTVETMVECGSLSSYLEVEDLNLNIANPYDELGYNYKLYLSLTNPEFDSDCIASNPDAFSMCGATASYEVATSEVEIISDLGNEIFDVCPGTEITLQTNNSSLPDAQVIWVATTEGGTVTYPGTGNVLKVYPTENTVYTLKDVCASGEIKVTIKATAYIAFGETYSATHYDTEGNYVWRMSFNDQDGMIRIPYRDLSEGINDGSFVGLYLRSADDTAVGTSVSLDFDNEELVFDLKKENQVSWDAYTTIAGKNIIPLELVLDASNERTGCSYTTMINLRLISPGAVWAPDEKNLNFSKNWNSDDNWKIYNPEEDPRTAYTVFSVNSASVPLATTDVIIPGTLNYYPELDNTAESGYDVATQTKITGDNFDPQASCQQIYFESGGEVAKQHYLDYLKAKVEINYGSYSKNGDSNPATSIKTSSKMLDRDRFYAMSAPLKNLVTGDYAFGSKPAVYMKYAEKIEYSGETPWGQPGLEDLTASFTVPLAFYNIELSPSRGFAFAVNHTKEQELAVFGKETKYPEIYAQTNLERYKGVLQLPNFEDAGSDFASGKGYSDHAKFTPGASETASGTSTFRYHVSRKPDQPYTEAQKAYDRTTRNVISVTHAGEAKSVYEAYRFVSENANNETPENLTITVRPNEENLIGNPFMSHLDFGKFYVGNKDNIDNYYRLWVGSNSYTITVDENGNLVADTETITENEASIGENAPSNYILTDDDLFIAPLQSVFIPVKSGATALTFTPEMSVTRSGASSEAFLRSGQIKEYEVLKVSARTPQYGTSIAIVRRPNGSELKSVSKLFSGENENVPELYIAGNSPIEIGEIHENTETVPVNLRTQATGEEVTFSFEGLENISASVKLYDSNNGSTTLLDEDNNTYSFINTNGNVEDRFYIQFVQNDYTATDDAAINNGFTVFSKGDLIKVTATSPSDLIQSITVSNAQGQTVAQFDNLSTMTYEFALSGSNLYLVEVATGKTNGVKKIIK